MKVNFSLNNFNPIYRQQKTTYQTKPRQIQPSFCGDTFVLSKKPVVDDLYLDIGHIYNKKTKEDVVVEILKEKNEHFITTYHFVSPTSKKYHGYVTLALLDEPKKYDSCYEGYEKKVLDDYPELDIVGPRAIVDYLRNNDEQEYGGVGLLADKLGVKHCLDNGFPPLIISEAAKNSHIAHYKRGKRFLPLKPESNEYKFFMERYGTADVNKIIKTSLEQSNGEKLDIREWPNLIMRLSEEKVEQYRKELGR